MRSLPACLLTMGLLTGQTLAQNPTHNWPQWRGPLRDGSSQETGLLKEWPAQGPKLLWSAKALNNGQCVGTGYSSMSIVDGKIYTMGDRKVDKKTGDGFVFCYDANTGKELWATITHPAQGDGPRCTPTVDGDRVYALSRQGILVCLDRHKGSLLWKKDFKKDFGGRMMSGWDYSESPLVDGDRLIVTPGGEEAALAALNKNTGEVVWKSKITNTGGAGYSSIIPTEVSGRRIYLTLLGKSRGLVAVDAKTGQFLANYAKVANGTANIPTPIVKDQFVFTSTGYGTGSALLKIVANENGGIDLQEVYFHGGKTLQNHHGGLIRLGDFIFGGHGHNDGQPFCLNMMTGEFTWPPRRGPGGGSAAVAYADGHLYFRYQDNVLALIEANPKDFVLKSSFELPKGLGTGWQHPVILHGKLYIRGSNEILCYDVKE